MSDAEEKLAPAAEIQKQLDSLKITLDAEILYRLESMFAKVSGWGAKGEIKRRAKLVKAIEPTLKEMLLPKEEVLYVAKGIQYSFAEQYFMGALWANLLNQTVFVLTNLRLLMMRSKSNGTPTHTFWVLYYSEIAEFKPSWTGVLKLKLRDKSAISFTGFPKLDRKAMPPIFQSALDRYHELGFEPPVSQSRENLCAECFQVVNKGRFVCQHCGAEYWKPMAVALRSLVFPSWGDFCMKHYGMAIMELIGYACSWFVAISLLTGPDPEAGVVGAGLIFLLEHPLDAAMTHAVAKKGLNPRRGPDPARAAAEKEALAEDLDSLVRAESSDA
jgi:hypothetical protein